MARSSWEPSGRLRRMLRERLTLANAGMRTTLMRTLTRLGYRVVFLLRDAMLQPGDFLFEFGDFVLLGLRGEGAMPFRERLFQLRSGKIGPARLEIDIPQVGVNRRVMAFALDGLPK